MHTGFAGDSPRMFADLGLARRLERAEGLANVESVIARTRLWPERGAAWINAGGGWAMFDGVESPLTQTFGLGLFGTIGPDEMDRIERFYAERGAPVFHEVCPLAESTLMSLLNQRRYRPFEFTSVLYRPMAASTPASNPQRAINMHPEREHRPSGHGVRVHPVSQGEHEVWARTAAEGWSEYPGLTDFMTDIGRLSAARADTRCFLATLEDRPVAAGALTIQDGVALLAGASTVPAYRRRGAQLALLHARLEFAALQGCDVAMMGAAPGSASQRNAERHGFRIAYTRLKWRLDR